MASPICPPPSTTRPAASRSTWLPTSSAVRSSTTCCASFGPKAATPRPARLPVRSCSSICAPCTSSNCSCTAPARARDTISVRYIEDKKIRPLVGGVYKLSDFHRAQADFIAKDFVGKLVVVPDAVSDLSATR
ncbi:hypothetical protein MES4922_360160 [Mesorhizobium ventifaucium]|uniref:Alcohol dehydrogenase-like C-terminal domain-containing protein n=1 Tax=Mesorhizobium ventifaucium TaxID=666020 RepID=A0ABM9E702_9HYPH|nr:hypothetical protein MES4922_360160 [Mesorhizobium ventifaucium]